MADAGDGVADVLVVGVAVESPGFGLGWFAGVVGSVAIRHLLRHFGVLCD